MKKRLKIKYPKLLVFLITVILAMTLFYEWMNLKVFHDFLTSLWYVWTFLGWLFYSYWFTSTSATGILLIIAEENILVLSIVTASIWAFISDMVIFLFAKNHLLQEITMFKEEKYIIKFRNFLKNTLWHKYIHIMPIVAGILIMTPLPTEIGITILASKHNMSTKTFMIMTYILHTIWIAIILMIGKLL